MKFPLVRDLAAEGFPVRLTCGVLGFSPQAFYKWQVIHEEIAFLRSDFKCIGKRWEIVLRGTPG